MLRDQDQGSGQAELRGHRPELELHLCSGWALWDPGRLAPATDGSRLSWSLLVEATCPSRRSNRTQEDTKAVRPRAREGGIAVARLMEVSKAAGVIAHPKHGGAPTAVRRVLTGQLVHGQGQCHVVAIGQQPWGGWDFSQCLGVLEDPRGVAEGHHQPDSVGSAGVPVQDTAWLLQGERGGRDLPFQVPGGYPRRVGDEVWGRGDRCEGPGPTALGAASPGWWGVGGPRV